MRKLVATISYYICDDKALPQRYRKGIEKSIVISYTILYTFFSLRFWHDNLRLDVLPHYCVEKDLGNKKEPAFQQALFCCVI